jgi:hypothetical protein
MLALLIRVHRYSSVVDFFWLRPQAALGAFVVKSVSLVVWVSLFLTFLLQPIRVPPIETGTAGCGSIRRVFLSGPLTGRFRSMSSERKHEHGETNAFACGK